MEAGFDFLLGYITTVPDKWVDGPLAYVFSFFY